MWWQCAIRYRVKTEVASQPEIEVQETRICSGPDIETARSVVRWQIKKLPHRVRGSLEFLNTHEIKRPWAKED